MKSNEQFIIETERLNIIPMTYSFVSKILENDATAYDEFRIKKVNEWPSVDIKEFMTIIKDKLSSQSVPDGFGPWLFINKSDRSIVGDGGFKDAPNNKGEIDIGYCIIESKRRKGYAYEAATALIKWGLSQDNVVAITADCLKDNVISRNLLRKLGMLQVNEDDEYIYYVLSSDL